MMADVCPGAVVLHILLADMLRRGVKAVLQCGFINKLQGVFATQPSVMMWA